MKRALTTALAVLLAAAFAFWIVSQHGEAAPWAPPGGEVTGPGGAGTPLRAELSGGRTEPDAAPLQRDRAEAADTAPSPDEAVLRGRCVDEDGDPLAGVTVSLHGSEASSLRMDAYRRDHGEVEWQDPEDSETEADGRFEVRFVPPPPFKFTLELRYPDLAPASGHWNEIEPGTVKDFGDVVLVRGVRVSGRVLDVDGVPRPEVVVLLNRSHRTDRTRGEVRARDFGHARTAADGSFRIAQPMAPGTWRVLLGNLVEPRDEVELELPATVLDLVVERAADLVAIRGIVVDEEGSPVRGAAIRPEGPFGIVSMTTSERDGTFTLEKRSRRDPQSAFRLRVESEGYEELTTEEAYEWGAEDVRLVLRSGLDVHIHVRRADDGTPVEDFGLRLLPDPATTYRRSWLEVLDGWRHEGGYVLAKGVRRGTHWVVVEPHARTGLARGGPVEVEVRDGPPPVVDVALAVPAHQEVRVARSDGTPVEGSLVELLEPLEGVDVGPGTDALSFRRWYQGWHDRSRDKVLRIDEERTDAAGACVLEGSPERTHTIRVSGADHAPAIRPGVRITGQPIEITVAAGATLRVELRPVEVLGDLREQAGLPRTGEVADAERRRLPGIRLIRGEYPAIEKLPPGLAHEPFGDEGMALLRGLPPGTWDVKLSVTTRFGRSTTTRGDTVRTGVVLREGEEKTIVLDMPEARLGRLRGRITLGGEPHAGQVEFAAILGTRPDGSPRRETRYAESDADGRFEALLPPGTWRAGARVRIGGDGLWAYSPRAVAVVAGQTAEAKFDARIGRVEIHLLRPDGDPAAGVQLSFQRGDQELPAHCPPTDAEGRSTATATPGDAVPQTRIRSLADPEEYGQYWRQHDGDPAAMQRIMVSLPRVLFTEGEPREVELRLPPDWDR